MARPHLLLLLFALLLSPSPARGCTRVGGVGAGGCPSSCLATCSAANFASTTSCTYTHVTTGLFFSASNSVTAACNVCYPTGAATATATATINNLLPPSTTF